jgi:uncharacterized protein (DUF2236 family)
VSARAVRALVASGVERALGGPPGLLEEYATPRGDPGLFGPGSPAWLVHADLPAMLVGGISSLMLQTLHPLAMAGVAEHSRYREDPFGRLQRTARFVAGTTFGSRELVDRLVGEVRAVHGYVQGIAPDGRAYSADDPHLLTWVHTTEVWSFLRSYQRYGTRPLLRVEKDRYLAEVREIAEALGARDVPGSVAEVRAYLAGIRGELEATPEALAAVHFLRTPLGEGPLDTLGHRIVTSAAIDLLPEFARRALRLGRPTQLGRAEVRAATTTFALLLRWALGPSKVLAVASERARTL